MKRRNYSLIGETMDTLEESGKDKELLKKYRSSEPIIEITKDMNDVLSDIEQLSFENIHLTWVKIAGYYLKLKEIVIKLQQVEGENIFGKEKRTTIHDWIRFGIRYEFQDKLFYNLNKRCLDFDPDMKILPIGSYNAEQGYNDILMDAYDLPKLIDEYITYAQFEGHDYFDNIVAEANIGKDLFVKEIIIITQDTPIPKHSQTSVKVVENYWESTKINAMQFNPASVDSTTLVAKSN